MDKQVSDEIVEMTELQLAREFQELHGQGMVMAKKGKKTMAEEQEIVAPKKSKKKKGNGAVLKKWREEHKGQPIKRRSSADMLWELKRLREYHLKNLATIEKKIKTYDKRVNADKRKALLARLSTEDLEKMVKAKMGIK